MPTTRPQAHPRISRRARTLSAVFLKPPGTPVGLRAIRSVFETTGEFGGFMETTMHIDGDVAFATWTSEGISFGSDTFVIREGKIVCQTVAIALV